ncbi:MAG: nucleotidyltransferase domain-containing protein [Candidatus Latescibacterota bacterium]
MYTIRDFSDISNIIRAYIPGATEIILFGSYARGEAQEESDADIVVIVEKTLEREEKLASLTKAWKALGKKGYRVDIIIKTQYEFDVDKDIPVTLSHTIFHEGKCLWKAHASVL